jgi:hypothetical protein
MTAVNPNASLNISEIKNAQKQQLAQEISDKTVKPGDGRITLSEVENSEEIKGTLLDQDFLTAFALESDLRNPEVDHEPTKAGYFKGLAERFKDGWDKP